MQVIPVLDLLGGQVVHAAGGDRRKYRPITSCLTSSCRPADVARAFRRQLGAHTVYVADLDAIQGGTPAWDQYDRILDTGLRMWLDCGMGSERDLTAPVTELLTRGLERLVLGSETLDGPEAVASLAGRLGWSRILFSLDLRDDEPLGGPAWQGRSPQQIARCIVEQGADSLLVLDLARVGSQGGVKNAPLLKSIRAAHPQLQLVVGGGVRGGRDLESLRRMGVSGVLVATALHQGTLRSLADGGQAPGSSE